MIDFSTLSLHETKTSDNYSGYAKQFLERLELKKDDLTPSTFKILNDIKAFPLPKIGESYRIRTQQQINLIAILLKILDEHHIIDELIITTYTLNKEAFRIICKFFERKRIKKLSLFLASSYSFRAPEEYEAFKSHCRHYHQQGLDVSLAFAWLHFKITLAKCGENYYHHEGSMNYSTNNMSEQLLFENRQEVYEWEQKFLHKVLLQHDLKSLEIIC